MQLPDNNLCVALAAPKRSGWSNESNQYTSISDGVTIEPTYDLDGNLVSDSVFAYEWDAENRLIGVTPLTPVNGSKRVRNSYD